MSIILKQNIVNYTPKTIGDHRGGKIGDMSPTENMKASLLKEKKWFFTKKKNEFI